MLSKVYEYLKQIFALKQQTEKNTADVKDVKDDIKDIRKEINDLHRTDEVIAHEMLRNHEIAERERKILLLQLEVALLRHDREKEAPFGVMDIVQDQSEQANDPKPA